MPRRLPDQTLHPVSALSQFNENPGEEHWKAAKRVLRYLRKTQDVGLIFTKTGEDLVGFSDADWGANADDRRSYSGYIFKYAGGVVSWAARKQKTVAMSSTEAEYVAEATKEALHLRSFLLEIFEETKATTIFCDNQSAGRMAEGSTNNNRTKHIDIRYHFIRDVVKNGIIDIKYLPTTEMPADILTKGLSTQKHENLIRSIGLEDHTKLRKN